MWTRVLCLRADTGDIEGVEYDCTFIDAIVVGIIESGKEFTAEHVDVANTRPEMLAAFEMRAFNEGWDGKIFYCPAVSRCRAIHLCGALVCHRCRDPFSSSWTRTRARGTHRSRARPSSQSLADAASR